MQSWIFQGKPDLFDIDGYLAAGLPRITWLVRQNAKKVAIGDEVFIWCSAGSSRGKEAKPAGIVAHAAVASLPWTGRDHQESDRFWHDRQGATAEEPRVWLVVESVAAAAGKVRRRQNHPVPHQFWAT